MKYSKHEDTILSLLLFTAGRREKNVEKHYLWVQALKKGGKQVVLGVLYRNIYVKKCT